MPGGLNFDAKLRRESTSIKDLFYAHISGMDVMARGLRNAAKMHDEGLLEAAIKDRYKSYSEGIGRLIVNGKVQWKMFILQMQSLYLSQQANNAGDNNVIISILNLLQGDWMIWSIITNILCSKAGLVELEKYALENADPIENMASGEAEKADILLSMYV